MLSLCWTLRQRTEVLCERQVPEGLSPAIPSSAPAPAVGLRCSLEYFRQDSIQPDECVASYDLGPAPVFARSTMQRQIHVVFQQDTGLGLKPISNVGQTFYVYLCFFVQFMVHMGLVP